MKKFPKIDGYKHISEITDGVIRKIVDFRDGKVRPLVTSSVKLNNKIGGLLFGEQIAIVAQSGVGKTGFLIWLLEELCNPVLNPVYEDKMLILFDTFEMQAEEVIMRSLANKMSSKVQDLLSYYEKIKDEKLEAAREVKARIDQLPIYYRQTAQGANEWLEHKKQLYGKLTDYYLCNAVDHTRMLLPENEASERERLDRLCLNGVWLKNNFNMLNIFLSQVNSNIETSTDREKLGKMLLQRTDVFGSSSLFQTCNQVFTLQRPGMFDLKEWNGHNTGLTKMLAGDDTLLVFQALKAREGNIGVVALRHKMQYYQIFDELPNDNLMSFDDIKDF